MKAKNKPHLTAKDMHAAQLLVDGKTQLEVVQESGLSRKTIQRRLEDPEFIAYMDKVRAENNRQIEKKIESAVKKINFTLPDAVEILVGIAKLTIVETKGNPLGQIKAVEALADLLRWRAAPIETVDGDAQPKAKFYRSEWMDDKPN